MSPRADSLSALLSLHRLGEHEYKKGTCMVCRGCGCCTGYGHCPCSVLCAVCGVRARLCHCLCHALAVVCNRVCVPRISFFERCCMHADGRERGLPCGCGAGDSGCTKCGLCKKCGKKGGWCCARAAAACRCLAPCLRPVCVLLVPPPNSMPCCFCRPLSCIAALSANPQRRPRHPSPPSTSS